MRKPSAPGTNSILEWIENRLPRQELLTEVDVQVATQINACRIRKRIEEGEFEAVNEGTEKRPEYRVTRASVVEFYRRRSNCCRNAR